MTKSETDTDLWDYLPTVDWETPRAVPTENTRQRFFSTARWLGHLFTTPEPDASSNRVPDCPRELAEHLVPQIDWQDAAVGLAAAIKRENLQSVALVGPPGSGISEITRLFAKNRRAALVDLPTSQLVLTQSEQILAQLHSHVKEPSENWLVIPQLERFFVRHPLGLELLRRLLHLLHDARRPILVGCDSWPWAFFESAVQISGYWDHCLSMKPLDDERLDRWLRRVARWPEAQILQADNEEPVCKPCDNPDDDAEISRIVHLYAAASRGIPEVARAMLQAGLRSESEEGNAAGPVLLAKPNGADFAWLDAAENASVKFVLHAVVLHGALDEATLCQILPFTPTLIRAALARLSRGNAIVLEQGLWRIALVNYPRMRQILEGDGFLVDGF
jgi:hypothetical protein